MFDWIDKKTKLEPFSIAVRIIIASLIVYMFIIVFLGLSLATSLIAIILPFLTALITIQAIVQDRKYRKTRRLAYRNGRLYFISRLDDKSKALSLSKIHSIHFGYKNLVAMSGGKTYFAALIDHKGIKKILEEKCPEICEFEETL